MDYCESSPLAGDPIVHDIEIDVESAKS